MNARREVNAARQLLPDCPPHGFSLARHRHLAKLANAMDDDADRSSILKRRAAFIAAALAGMTAATNCGGKVVFVDGDGSGAEAQGGAGGAGGEGAGTPQPCLGAPLGGEGGMPQPCLDAPIGGEGGARPCLTPQ